MSSKAERWSIALREGEGTRKKKREGDDRFNPYFFFSFSYTGANLAASGGREPKGSRGCHKGTPTGPSEFRATVPRTTINESSQGNTQPDCEVQVQGESEADASERCCVTSINRDPLPGSSVRNRSPRRWRRCHRPCNRAAAFPKIPPKINVSRGKESHVRPRDQVRCSNNAGCLSSG